MYGIDFMEQTSALIVKLLCLAYGALFLSKCQFNIVHFFTDFFRRRQSQQLNIGVERKPADHSKPMRPAQLLEAEAVHPQGLQAELLCAEGTSADSFQVRGQISAKESSNHNQGKSNISLTPL